MNSIQKSIAFLFLAALPLTAFGGPVSPDQLNGNWRVACSKAPTTVYGSHSTVLSFSVKSGAVTIIEQTYAQKDCKGSVQETIEARGSYRLQNGNAEITTNITSATMTVNTPAATANEINSEMCGYSNWVTGETKNIYGTECFPDINGEAPTAVDLIAPNTIKMTDYEGTSKKGYETIIKKF